MMLVQTQHNSWVGSAKGVYRRCTSSDTYVRAMDSMDWTGEEAYTDTAFHTMLPKMNHAVTIDGAVDDVLPRCMELLPLKARSFTRRDHPLDVVFEKPTVMMSPPAV